MGIIPACAGNTSAAHASASMRREHPRMRGEHERTPGSHLHFGGSSPHARGTRSATCFLKINARIIPACAGNTRAEALACQVHRDHPRMRGEHSSASSVQTLCPGSSPHARGTLVARVRIRIVPGIIPACAGNTDDAVVVWCERGDHPRMRGEHTVPYVAFWRRVGSSPHARGTRTRS